MAGISEGMELPDINVLVGVSYRLICKNEVGCRSRCRMWCRRKTSRSCISSIDEFLV